MKTTFKYFFILAAVLVGTVQAWGQAYKIGTTTYATLQEALNAATSGQTVELTTSAALISEVTMPTGKTITLDLGGHTLTTSTSTSSNAINFKNDETSGSSLTVKNGTIDGTHSNATIRLGGEGNTLVIASDATVTNHSGEAVIAVMNGTSEANTLTVAGKVKATGSAKYAISSNGSKTYYATITISESANITSIGRAAIYLPGGANVSCTIDGGTIAGPTGVYVKSGKLTINGGDITGSGTKTDYTYVSVDANATGDAVVVDNCNYPGGAPSVNINGGTFESTYAKPIASYYGGTATEPITKFLGLPTPPKTLTLQGAENIEQEILKDGLGAVISGNTITLETGGFFLVYKDKNLLGQTGDTDQDPDAMVSKITVNSVDYSGDQRFDEALQIGTNANISIVLGTAYRATNVVLKVEYWNGSTWTTLTETTNSSTWAQATATNDYKRTATNANTVALELPDAVKAKAMRVTLTGYKPHQLEMTTQSYTYDDTKRTLSVISLREAGSNSSMTVSEPTLSSFFEENFEGTWAPGDVKGTNPGKYTHPVLTGKAGTLYHGLKFAPSFDILPVDDETVNSGWLNVGNTAPATGDIYYWVPGTGLTTTEAGAYFKITFGQQALRNATGMYWGDPNGGEMSITVEQQTPFLRLTKAIFTGAGSGTFGAYRTPGYSGDVTNPNPSGSFDWVLSKDFMTVYPTAENDYSEEINTFACLRKDNVEQGGAEKITLTLDDAQRISHIFIEYEKRNIKKYLTGEDVTFNLTTGATDVTTVASYSKRTGEDLLVRHDYTGAALLPIASLKDNKLNELIADTEYEYDTPTDEEAIAAGYTADEISKGYIQLVKTAQTAPGRYLMCIAAKSTSNIYFGRKLITFIIGKEITNPGISVQVDPVTFKNAEYTKADIEKLVKVYDVSQNPTLLEVNKHYEIDFISGHKEFYDARQYDNEIIIRGILAEGYNGERNLTFIINPIDISGWTAKAAIPYDASDTGTKTWTDVAKLNAVDSDNPADGNADGVTVYLYNEKGQSVNYIFSGMEGTPLQRTYSDKIKSAENYWISDTENGNTTEFIVTLKEQDYTNAGEYEGAVTISPVTDKESPMYTGNYVGSINTSLFITSDYEVDQLCTVISNAIYTGSELEPTKDLIDVYYTDPVTKQKTQLQDDEYDLTFKHSDIDKTVTDYEPVYKDAKTYGNALTITGKGKYSGTFTVDYIIKPRDISASAEMGIELNMIHRMIWHKTLNVSSPWKPDVNFDRLDTYEVNNYKTSIFTSNPFEWEAGDNLETTSSSYGNRNNFTFYYKDSYSKEVGGTPKDFNYVYFLQYGTDYEITACEPSVISELGEYTLTFTGRGNFIGSRQATLPVVKDITKGDEITFGNAVIPTQTLLTESETSDYYAKYGSETDGSTWTPTTELTDVTFYDLQNGGEKKALEYKKDYTVSFAPKNATKSDGVTTWSTTELNQIKNGWFPESGVYVATIRGNTTNYYFGTVTRDVIFTMDEHRVQDITAPNDGNQVAIHLVPAGEDGEEPVANVIGVPAGGTRLTIPSQETVTIYKDNGTDKTQTFTLVGIEDDAFVGTGFQYVDAEALTDYVPTTLDREATGPFNGLAKQALVYLNGENAEGENYVYKNAAGNRVAELIKIYDENLGDQTGWDGNDYEWAFANKYDFTAKTVENNRKMTANSKDGTKKNYYTVLLPYSIETPATLKAYQLSAASDKIIGVRAVETAQLEALKPYIVETTTDDQPLNATNAEFKATEGITDLTKIGETATATGNFTIYGTLEYIATPANGSYILQDGGQWKKVDGATGYDGNKVCVLPMRAYINATAAPSRFMTEFIYADGTSSLEQIDVNAEDGDIYDLQGRKMNDARNLRQGVYIQNGRKAILRK